MAVETASSTRWIGGWVSQEWICTRWERLSCLCRESASTHTAGSLVSTLTKLTSTQDTSFNVPIMKAQCMIDWLLPSEEQMCNWCQSKHSDIASSLNFILWASLFRRLNSCFTFCYRMQGPWHICHHNVRLLQKSYCRIWENLYSTHILINKRCANERLIIYPQHTNPALLCSYERQE